VGCAVWGLGLGFLYHISKDEYITEPKKKPTAITPKGPERPGKGPLAQATKVDGYEDTGDIIATARQNLSESETLPVDSTAKPYVPTMKRLRYGGVSGRNLPYPALAHAVTPGHPSASPAPSPSLEPEIDDVGQGPEMDF
jgi:hypothetical protein